MRYLKNYEILIKYYQSRIDNLPQTSKCIYSMSYYFFSVPNLEYWDLHLTNYEILIIYCRRRIDRVSQTSHCFYPISYNSFSLSNLEYWDELLNKLWDNDNLLSSANWHGVSNSQYIYPMSYFSSSVPNLEYLDALFNKLWDIYKILSSANWLFAPIFKVYLPYVVLLFQCTKPGVLRCAI